jgi:hypothetical protein
MLNGKLFGLLGEKTQTGIISHVLEFKPAMAYYVVKSITQQPATTEDYLQNKSFAALRSTLDSSVGMGLVHFDPAQISKRMNYARTPQDNETEQAGPNETPKKD